MKSIRKFLSLIFLTLLVFAFVFKGVGYKLMQKRAELKGFTFPYLIDDRQDIYPQFGATKTPQMYVLQKTIKGNVLKYIGAIDDNYKDANAVNTKYVENAVDALLLGKEVNLPETKAIGCGIK